MGVKLIPEGRKNGESRLGNEGISIKGNRDPYLRSLRAYLGVKINPEDGLKLTPRRGLTGRGTYSILRR